MCAVSGSTDVQYMQIQNLDTSGNTMLEQFKGQVRGVDGREYFLYVISDSLFMY